MAKRTQILRVPQKKYTGETAEEMPALGLPHETLIPPGQDAVRGDGAHGTGAAASPGSGYSAPGNDREAAGAPRASHSAGDNGGTGHTGYTGITGRVTPTLADGVQNNAGAALKGRTRDVWDYFCQALNDQKTGGNRVRASRRQIQRGSGVGSLNTIDSAIATLQGRGWLRVHPLPGSNEGYEYEVLVERASGGGAETPGFIAETLQRAAGVIRRRGESLTPEHLNKWSRVAHQINRLVDEF